MLFGYFLLFYFRGSSYCVACMYVWWEFGCHLIYINFQIWNITLQVTKDTYSSSVWDSMIILSYMLCSHKSHFLISNTPHIFDGGIVSNALTIIFFQEFIWNVLAFTRRAFLFLSATARFPCIAALCLGYIRFISILWPYTTAAQTGLWLSFPSNFQLHHKKRTLLPREIYHTHIYCICNVAHHLTIRKLYQQHVS